MSEFDLPTPPRGTVLPPPQNPLAVARRLMRGTEAARGVRRWRGDWLRYRGPHWTMVAAEEVRAWAWRATEHAEYKRDGERVPWSPMIGRVSNLVEALGSTVYLPEDIAPPSWIGPPVSGAPPADRVIACRNGLLDVETRKLWPAVPEFFTFVSVPFDFDPGAPPPTRWLMFLRSLWGEDEESVALLQEWFGYVLSGHTDLQKALLMLGPKRSGKGTIARVLEALVGKANTAGPTLASLGTNFGLWPLVGKSLAVVSDARLGDNSRTIAERLLTITGEDMITVDRKNREPWTGQIPARFMILSNEVPRFNDASGALADRMVTLTMSKSFLGREDRTLGPALRPELPGILLWALDGLDRLMGEQRGAFTAPTAAGDAVGILHDLVSPVRLFGEEHCVFGKDERGEALTVEIDALYLAYGGWCQANGQKEQSKQIFGRDLRAAFPDIRDAPRPHGTKRRYAGIALRPPA